MTLKKPSIPAAIFNNFIFKNGSEYVFKIGDKETIYRLGKIEEVGGPINLPLLLSGAVYGIGDELESGKINPSSYKLFKIADRKGKPATPVLETSLLFPVLFKAGLSGGASVFAVDAGASPYYNKDYAAIIRLGSESKMKDGEVFSLNKVEDLFDFAYKFLTNREQDNFFTLPELEMIRTLKEASQINGFDSPGLYNHILKLDSKTMALLDHYFNNEESIYSFLANDVAQTKINYDNAFKAAVQPGAPPQPPGAKTYPFEFSPTTLEMEGVNGLSSDPRMGFLGTILKPDGEIRFDYLNFSLKPTNPKVLIKMVSTTSFAKKFLELNQEPQVPKDAKENNIVSFYHKILAQHDNDFDDTTFMYKDQKFSDFEIDVIASSTLKEKSNTLQDFTKPYASVEFYADFKTDTKHKKTNVQHAIWPEQQQRINNYKRYATSKRVLEPNLKGVINNDGSKLVDLYSEIENKSSTATKFLENGSYDLKIKSTQVSHGPEKKIATQAIANAPMTLSPIIEPIKPLSEMCSYEVVGYSLTKSTSKPDDPGYENSIIKRIFILNDTPEHKGYLKYFDSQIKEDKTYYYSIEQINLVYGVNFRYKIKGYEENFGANQKKFLNFDSDKNYADVPPVLSTLSPATTAAEKKLNDKFPFYNTKDLFAKISLGSSYKNFIVYTPVGKIGQFASPDIEFSNEIIKTPVSQPNVRIFTRRGETNKAHIVVGSLMGGTQQIIEIEETDVEVIDLGIGDIFVENAVKEYFVYRTTKAPKDYDSFPKEPHKILPSYQSDFTDDVFPNVEYYYYALARGIQGGVSKPSAVLKLQIVNEQSLVYTLLEGYNFD